MYGMVNRAVQQMVQSRFGEATWQRIKARAGITTEQFVQMQQYADEVTYKLVGAASEELGLPPSEILETFGYYWITYTAAEGYGDLMHMGGRNVQQFLVNLDALHARVGSAFENLVPPSFRCTDLTGDTLVLHYHSRRQGLAPLVVGLLRGLGDRFKQTVQIEHRDRKGDGADHDTFFLRISAPPP